MGERWRLGLGFLLWLPLAVGVGEEAGGEDAAPAVALLSVTVERTLVLAEDPGAAATTARGSQLLLRVRLDAAAKSLVREQRGVTVAGTFDDSAATPVALLEAARQHIVMEGRAGGGAVLQLACELPPAGARAISELVVTAGRPEEAAGNPESLVQRYTEIKDLRPKAGEKLGRPGRDEEWYQVESFGPKSFSMRRLTEDAPPIEELVFANVDGAVIAPIPLASKSIRDPVQGGWVAVLVFEQHVPLVVNMLVPEPPPAPEVLLQLDRVDLP